MLRLARERARDLEAIVSASGKVQPKRQVNISANRMGKVTRLAVEEGQTVKAGQFLLEIDPRSLAGQLERGEASVEAARSALQLAAFTTVLLAGLELVLTHWYYPYLVWFYPFAVITLLAI